MPKAIKNVDNGFWQPKVTKIRINFIQNTTISIYEWFLILLSSLLFSCTLWQYWHVHRQVMVQQNQLERINMTKKVVKIEASSQSAEERQAFSSAIASLNNNWGNVFAALEKCQTTKVSLIELAPDFSKKEMLVVAQTEDTHQMLEYIQALKAMPNISSVVLNGQELQESDAQPLVFNFSVRWD